MLKSEIDQFYSLDNDRLDYITYYTRILEEFRMKTNPNKKVEEEYLTELQGLDHESVKMIVMNMSK